MIQRAKYFFAFGQGVELERDERVYFDFSIILFSLFLKCGLKVGFPLFTIHYTA